jgi:hypothetical protein
MMTPPAATIVAPARLPAELESDRFLDCIVAVERRPGHRMGRHGELGDYQFKKVTWASLTDLPFSDAEKPAYARLVARVHLRNLRHQLAERHLEVTVYNLALMWKGGASVVILHKWQPQAARDYAQRVENLYIGR